MHHKFGQELRVTHLQISSANLFPYSTVIDKVSRFLTNASSQCFQVSFIVQLIQKTRKEPNVSRRIDEMSSRPFVVWLPNLNSHCLCEDLLVELVFSAEYSSWIGGIIIVDGVSGLIHSQIALRYKWHEDPPSLPCDDANLLCPQI